MTPRTNPIFWLFPLLALSLFLTAIIVFTKMEQEKIADKSIVNNCFTQQSIVKKELPAKIHAFFEQEHQQIIIEDMLKIEAIKMPAYLINTTKGEQFIFDKNGDFICRKRKWLE